MRTLSLLLLITLVAAAPRAFAQRQASDEAAIRGRIQALETALNAHDARGGAALFAEDGDQIVGRSALYRGRPVMERAYREKLLALPKGRHIAIKVRSIRFPTPDVALVDVEGHLVEAPETTKDRAFYVMVQRDGSWLISALRVMDAEGPNND